MSVKNEKIGIFGSGLIGGSWAMIFASVGYQVQIYDIVPEQISGALKRIENELKQLEKENILRGTLTAQQQFKCITGTTDIKELVKGAAYIQECVPENIELKRKIYAQLDAILEDQTILASSTSTFLPSVLSAEMKRKSQVIIAHPVNPPYYVPLIEVVPAPWTKPEIALKTKQLLLDVGQKPVLFTREIEGFAVNRVQYAILNEVWRLVASGVLNVRDIDSVMSDGLGMRYAFLGPLETAHLNAEGWANYCDRYHQSIYDVSQTFGEIPKMEGPVVAEIAKQLEEMCPINKLPARREWRDNCLTQLSQLKKKI
ncbi:lambda-crystallin [Sitodiplosis mosellana]|uniref:lambda-crystallin n=1 Tax=Sitodiplosis mosellana TaxID=263140 RepID=UPI002443D6AE|nr:lambda-crystallin [Sitodiplosis mosellana]